MTIKTFFESDETAEKYLENSITKKKTLKWEWMRRGEINSIMKGEED